jgi:hypothetical protein
MSIVIYLKGKRARFFGSIGWFSGEEFSFLKIELFSVADDTLYILNFQFIKFEICVGLEPID